METMDKTNQTTILTKPIEIISSFTTTRGECIKANRKNLSYVTTRGDCIIGKPSKIIR